MSEFTLQFIKIAFSSFVSIFILFHFMDRVFNRIYQSKGLYYGMFILCWILFIVCAVFENALVSLAFSTVLTIGIGILLYDARKNSDILTLFLFLLFLMLTEVLGQFIVALIFSRPLSIAHGDTMQSLITFTCYQIAIYFICRKKKEFNRAGNWITIIVIPAISLFQIYAILSLLNTQADTTEMFLAVSSCLLMFMINIIVFTLFNRIAKLHYENEQYQLLEQQKQMQYKYFNELEQNYEESKKFFHDIKNHLNTIEQLYQWGDGATKEYVSTLKEKMNDLGKPIPSKNRIVNILIHKWELEAKTKGVDFTYQCENVDLSFVSDIDLNTILTNLLDNAFEECFSNRLERNFVTFSLCQINNFVVINIVNSCGTVPVSSGQQLLSQKENHFGLGLTNVQKTVERYQGILDTKYEDQTFTVQLTFFGQST